MAAAGTYRRGGLVFAAVALVVAVGLALAVTAFTAARTKDQAVAQPVPAGHPTVVATTTPPAVPKVKVSADGLVKGLQPWKLPITLHVRNGTLLSVSAFAVNEKVLPGTVTGKSWVSTGRIVPNRTYQVQAYAKGKDGSRAYHTLSVTSSPPDATIDTSVAPLTGRTVGVGFAITVQFGHPVTDRVAAEKALQVTTSTPVVGSWHWFSDTVVHYRPRTYWPAHTQVTLHDHLVGVELSPGVWGQRDRDITFTIGDAHVSTVDVATQHMTVTDNGRRVGYYKVSTGRAEFPTKGGVHVVLDKVATKTMDSTQFGFAKGSKDYYHETVLWDTRISDGGAFVHYAPWSVKSQGRQPVSHGCVNANLKDAVAFYDLSIPGDVVDIVNDPVPPKLDDPGMVDWNLTWAQWKAGSALS